MNLSFLNFIQHELLVAFSGRGDKDVDYVVENFGAKYGVSVPKYEMPKAEAALSAA